MSPSTNHIRGRGGPRNPLFFKEPTPLPIVNRPFRITTSRPRTYIPNPNQSGKTAINHPEHKKPRPLLIRIPLTSLVLTSIALAFFVFGVIVSSNLSATIVSPGTRDLPLSVPADHRSPPSSFPDLYPISNITSPNVTKSLAVPPHSARQHRSTPSRPSTKPMHHHKKPDQHAQGNTAQLSKTYFSNESATAPQPSSQSSKNNGRIGWERSWPTSPQKDYTHLIPIANALKFNNRTLINYFHMHKTGGVTLKAEVMGLINRLENKQRSAKRGHGLGFMETCYEVEAESGDLSLESMWRCDFGKVRGMTENQLKAVDIVMGHQYWDEGTEFFFPSRDVRHFSIFRHPLPRKLSFFYHFFVRNRGRDEAKVGKEEVIKFLLGQDMPDAAYIRDAGPNYYASRMLSDGLTGFVGYRYELTKRQGDDAISKVNEKFLNKYALVGLQLQSEASQCMVEKLLQVLAHAHGIDDLVGTPKLSFHTAKLNTGGYPWTSTKIWNVMTPEQRKRYREVERVDLAIYERAVREFKEDVKLFSCDDNVNEEAFLEDVFE